MKKVNKATFAKSVLLHEDLDETLVWDGQADNSSYTVYSPSGSIRLKGTVKNGKLEGKKIRYSSNGKVSQTAFYVNGGIHGEFKVYYENGSLLTKSFYKRGIVHGPYSTYHLNGQVLCDVNYNNGTKVGTERRYHSNGNIRLECTYNEKGALDGYLRCYTKRGKLKSELLYKNGVAVI